MNYSAGGLMAEPLTPPPSASGRITVPRDTGEARTFYQERIAQFSRLVCLLSLFFFLVNRSVNSI